MHQWQHTGEPLNYSAPAHQRLLCEENRSYRIEDRMVDISDENQDARIVLAHKVELSDRELLSIGYIVAQWGALEHEIFYQTLLTFKEDTQGLPKEMNNMQFSEVLEIWKERVVNRCTGERKTNLTEQYALIRHYHNYRNALVHGMWDWDRTSPDRIRTTRVRKKEVIPTHFTAADLETFSLELAKINFNIRCPTGIEDLAEVITAGGYIGRFTTSMLLGHTVAADLVPGLKLTENLLGKVSKDVDNDNG